MDSQLSNNIKQQTQRLLDQLKELQELKADLEPEEYESMKKETLSQLQTFEKGLEDMKSQNLSLTDQIAKAQTEIQNAVQSSFNTDLIKKTFASSQAGGIREKIKNIERDYNLNKIDKTAYVTQTLNKINDLNDLKIQLEESEKEFLQTFTGRENFVTASKGDVQGDKYIKQAEKQLKNNK